MITHRSLIPPYTGYSRAILDTYLELSSRGINIMIITITGRRVSRCWNLGRLKVIEIPEPSDVFIKLVPSRIALRILRENMLAYHLDNITRYYASRSIVEKIASLHEKIHGRGPDVVVSETLYTSLLGAKIADLLSIPLIIRIHNVEYLYVSSLIPSTLSREIFCRRIFKLEKILLDNADQVLTISWRDSLIVKHIYNVNSVYIPPVIRTYRCIDPKRYFSNVKLKPYRYFLFVASMHRPNIMLLHHILRCCPILTKYGYRLVIAGTISHYLLRYLKMKPCCIKIVGVINLEELSTLIRHAYAFIAPHYGQGVPIKILEALRYETPVITTKNTLHTIKGLMNRHNIMAVNDPELLPHAVREIIENQDLYEKIKSNIKLLNNRILNPRILVEEMLATLKHLVCC